MAATSQVLPISYAPVKRGSLARLVHDTWTLYRRAIIRMTRAPAQLYFSLIQPLVWFLLFGQLFSRLTSFAGGRSNFGTDNYETFFLPAIIIQMILFGATSSALGIINDDQTGYLNKLRVTPINRFSILFGSLLADLTRMLVQVVVLTVIGLIFGVRIAHYWYFLTFGVVIVVFFGLMMGGIGLYIGLSTRSTQATFLIINFLTLPLLFTSSAQLPISLLPDWMQVVAHVNPLTYAIDSLRAIVVGLNQQQINDGNSVIGMVAQAFLILGVLMLIMLTLAVRKFSKQVAK